MVSRAPLLTFALLVTACRIAEPWREPATPKPGASLAPRGSRLVDPRAKKQLTLLELLAWAEAHAPSLRVAEAEAERGDAEV
ncbi:MAG TPA: hypothetical protein VFB62_05520, partial [Polyangiaceae bacterium]|nr:hypothetical protein [Polyangiaceae bacterium]